MDLGLTGKFAVHLPTLCHFWSGVVQPCNSIIALSCLHHHIVVYTKSHFCHILSC